MECEEGFVMDFEPHMEIVRAGRTGKGARDVQFAGKSFFLTIIALNWKQTLAQFLEQTGDFGGLKNLGKFMSQDGLAKRLRAIPAAGNANDTFTFHKVVNMGKLNPEFSSSLPRKLNLNLIVLPDFTQPETEVFFKRTVS